MAIRPEIIIFYKNLIKSTHLKAWLFTMKDYEKIHTAIKNGDDISNILNYGSYEADIKPQSSNYHDLKTVFEAWCQIISNLLKQKENRDE